MMTDPIADMLTRIRNAQMARLPHVRIPASKLKRAIAELLAVHGYVGEISSIEGKPAMFSIELKYHGKVPAIRSIKRESTPGHRKYTKGNEVPRVLNDYGIAIISTSKGLMTNKEARKLGIGGEIICSVY